MSYDVVFLRDQPRQAGMRLGPFPNLLNAARRRVVSGDLIVYSGTTDVVPRDWWLWPWERERREQSYAWREVQAAKRLRATGLA